MLKRIAGFFSNEITAPINAVGDLFDKLFTSDDERLNAQAILEKIRQHPAELQVAVNKIEAGHRSIFVAGWRPFIGWVCGVSLACYFIPQYLIAAYVWAVLILSTDTIPAILPPFPVVADGLMELVIALLGLGVIRTTEKLRRVSK